MHHRHEGHIFYLGTYSYSPAQLTSLPSLHHSRLSRRATNCLLLGISLPPLLEMHSTNPVEYLRSFSTLLNEYDTYCQLSASDSASGLGRGRMGAMLKSGMRGVKSRRSSAATEMSMAADMSSLNGSTSNLSSLADALPLPPMPGSGHDFQYLMLPNLPFDPDFSTSFTTLTDVLIDAYAGLLQLLPSPETCPPSIAEPFAKADKQMRKILMSGVVNEFGDTTRKEAKAEVGGLGKLVLSGLM